MGSYQSAESIFGWEPSYLSLPVWMDRIREAHSSGNRERDELDYYMCFFTQCFSLKDWMVHQGVIDAATINSLFEGHDEMRICRDICNRYKHLTISKPSIDAHWEIKRSARPFTDGKWDWIIHFGGGKRRELWGLMTKCIEFWESCVAAFGLEPKGQRFERRFPI
jgi:hypothetical protein